jgi:hypothetical protein
LRAARSPATDPASRFGGPAPESDRRPKKASAKETSWKNPGSNSSKRTRSS